MGGGGQLRQKSVEEMISGYFRYSYSNSYNWISNKTYSYRYK